MNEEAWSPRLSSPDLLPTLPSRTTDTWSALTQRLDSRTARMSRSAQTASPGNQNTSLLADTPTTPRALQRRVNHSSQVPALSLSDPVSPPLTTFDPPLRSIFVSGPPTASVSANTAHASLSAATTSNGTGSLAAFSSAGNHRRNVQRSNENVLSTGTFTSNLRNPLFITEKDVDDPNSSYIADYALGTSGNTSTTINRLFGLNSASPGAISREPSQMQVPSTGDRNTSETKSLAGHLLQHGFQGGKHSDITIHAFNKSYKLHKLLLDRVPFFSSAFSGAWVESSAQEMTLRPTEIDSNITQSAFEMALKQIYGTPVMGQESSETIGLFAVACWLDMPDLVDYCVENIIRDMEPSNLRDLIQLVTNSYYGKPGERILASTKAMLFREGWQMPIEYWDEIPAEIVCELVGGDPFFITGEWERWLLALKLLNRRLRQQATKLGLTGPDGHYLQPRPANMHFCAIRPDRASLTSSGMLRTQPLSDHENPWTSLYLNADIIPLLTLLDERIHYIHLRFEQLQQIRAQKDVLGVPVLPEKVIADALWTSMELRQRIMNAHENELELGIAEEGPTDDDMTSTKTNFTLMFDKGKNREDSPDVLLADQTELEQPRRFWIPTTDVSGIMGGTREACLAGNPTNTADWNMQGNRLSANLDPVDFAWVADATDGSMNPRLGTSNTMASVGRPTYSRYPPFRFSSEFPNPRTIREKKRVYSQTVWYAGSLWNLYIQRVNSSTGIYLHRAKDKDPSTDPLAQFFPSSVDDRIGRLEREMLLRTAERRKQQRLSEASLGVENNQEDDSGISEAESDGNITMLNNRTLSSNASGNAADRKGSVVFNVHKVSQTPHDIGILSTSSLPLPDIGRLPDVEEEDAELRRMTSRFNVPAMPAYTDSRQVIKTYFKIYSPEKAGRLLSIYESAPEKFVVSKSWGWKGSQMLVDDRVGGHEVGGARDGKLRYMVVIGNI